MAPEVARRASAERYELALRAGGAGTWFWDRRTGDVDWDTALEGIYGLEPGTFGGTFDDWVAKVHPDDRDEALARLDAALLDEVPHYLLYRTVRPDGELRWLEARGKVLRDHTGEVAAMVGVCHDVTERQEARLRLELLARAGGVLGQSLDVDRMLGELAELVVPELGDWCTIDLVEGRELRPVAVAHADPARAELVHRLREDYGYSTAYGPGKVVRTGSTERLLDVSDDVLRGVAQDDAHLAALRQLDPSSAVTVPLRARRQTLGALTLVHGASGRRHDADDVAVIEDLARRAATAVDNALLFAERSRVAAMLQRALLPYELPEIPSVELASHYDTAQRTDIGGDFYDVIATNGGWTLVLGDVCGKGLEAASLTSLARHTVRAAALRSSDPAEVLAVLNDALLEHEAPESFCTAVCAHLVVEDAGIRLDLATGGHPPPMVMRADGEVEQPDCSGMLIGLFDTLELEPTSVVLGPDELAVFYTDGLTEARRGYQQFGSQRLRGVLRESRSLSTEALLKHVHATVEAYQDEQSDDMAMLALRPKP